MKHMFIATALLVGASVVALMPGSRSRRAGSAPPTRGTIAVTDTTANLRRIIGSASNGDTVRLGPGRWRLDSTIILRARADFTIEGAGSRSIVRIDTLVRVAFRLDSGITRIRLRKFVIEGTGLGRSSAVREQGIETLSAVRDRNHISIDSMRFQDLNIGVELNATQSAGSGDLDSVSVTNSIFQRIRGSTSGLGYGIVLSRATRALIADNEFWNTGRHAIYQGRASRGGRVVIDHNLVVNHARDESSRPMTNAAIAVARSSSVTVARNLVVNAFATAFSVENDETLSWPITDIHHIDNVALGTHPPDLLLSAAGRYTAWGNRYGRESRNRGDTVAGGARVTTLEVPSRWKGTQAVTGCGGRTFCVMQSNRLYEVVANYDVHPNAWSFRSDGSRDWSGFQGMAYGAATGALYVMQNDRLTEVKVGSWVKRRDTSTNWRGFQSMAAAGGSVFVAQNGILHRVTPSTWAYTYVRDDWSGAVRLEGFGNRLFGQREGCTYEIETLTLARALIGCRSSTITR